MSESFLRSRYTKTTQKLRENAADCSATGSKAEPIRGNYFLIISTCSYQNLNAQGVCVRVRCWADEQNNQNNPVIPPWETKLLNVCLKSAPAAHRTSEDHVTVS